MVESVAALDLLFAALADSTRRDILDRVSRLALSVGEIADHYQLTFAAISKHVQVLERARLVVKHRRGKEQVVTLVPATLSVAKSHIERYAALWADRFEQLETVLKQEE